VADAGHDRARERARESMMAEYHVGLDVSLDETSVCVVDQDGKVLKECKAATEPADIALSISIYADVTP
jgi:predicted NBD/HSP70 family sugar kinase